MNEETNKQKIELQIVESTTKKKNRELWVKIMGGSRRAYFT